MDKQPGIYIDHAGNYWLRKPGKWLLMMPVPVDHVKPFEPVIRLFEKAPAAKSNGGNQNKEVSDNT